MRKKILLIISILVLLLVGIEGVRILQLKSSVTSYAAYWRQRAQQPGEITYVALGDSAAQGIGASAPQNGYVGLIAGQIALQTGRRVRVVNLSVSGARVADVSRVQIPELKQYHPNIITMDIGANDMQSYNKARFIEQYDVLAKSLPAGTIVGNIPYFGGRIRHNAYALEANPVITSAAKQYHLQVADLQGVTRARQSVLNYAADFFHPSNRGYRNWYAAYQPLVINTVKTLETGNMAK